MIWLEQWIERRRLHSLKQKIARLKKEAAEAENYTGLPAFDGATQKIRLERIVVLEQAVDKLEGGKRPAASDSH
jgi:hypothetical protein